MRRRGVARIPDTFPPRKIDGLTLRDLRSVDPASPAATGKLRKHLVLLCHSYTAAFAIGGTHRAPT